jgi:hypothetical protein
VASVLDAGDGPKIGSHEVLHRMEVVTDLLVGTA